MSVIDESIHEITTVGLDQGICPGDDLSKYITSTSNTLSTSKLRFQDGILKMKDNNRLIASKGGVLASNDQNDTYWIQRPIRFYEPSEGGQVIGIIEDKGGDFYKVNILGGQHAILSRLGFEGATKRNKPELKRGDIVYARILSCKKKDLDVEITCLSGSGLRKEWTSGETIYGELSGGLVLKISIDFAHSLLQPNVLLFDLLGKEIAFEACIGCNGWIWFKASKPLHNIVLRNAILNAETLDDAHIEAMVEKLITAMKATKT